MKKITELSGVQTLQLSVSSFNSKIEESEILEIGRRKFFTKTPLFLIFRVLESSDSISAEKGFARETGNSRLCVRCDEEYVESERKRKEEEEENAAKTKNKVGKKKNLRDRMKRLANQPTGAPTTKKPKK